MSQPNSEYLPLILEYVQEAKRLGIEGECHFKYAPYEHRDLKKDSWPWRGFRHRRAIARARREHGSQAGCYGNDIIKMTTPVWYFDALPTTGDSDRFNFAVDESGSIRSCRPWRVFGFVQVSPSVHYQGHVDRLFPDKESVLRAHEHRMERLQEHGASVGILLDRGYEFNPGIITNEEVGWFRSSQEGLFAARARFMESASGAGITPSPWFPSIG